MFSRNRFPFRVEYRTAEGELKWSEPFADPKAAQVLVAGLRAAGATDISVFHDGAQRPTCGVSVSKYPGNPHRKWNGYL